MVYRTSLATIKLRPKHTNGKVVKIRSTRSGTHEDEFRQQDKPGYNKIEAAKPRQGMCSRQNTPRSGTHKDEIGQQM